MSARERLGRARAELAFKAACLERDEALQSAKEAYAADPTPQNAATRKAAMAEHHHFRKTFRGIDYLRAVRAKVAMAPQDRARFKASLAKMRRDDPDRPKVEAKLARLAALEAELPGLEDEWGPISAYFEAMAGLPEGAQTPAPEPTKPAGRVRRNT
jgi:hypothetical protein